MGYTLTHGEIARYNAETLSERAGHYAAELARRADAIRRQAEMLAVLELGNNLAPFTDPAFGDDQPAAPVAEIPIDKVRDALMQQVDEIAQYAASHGNFADLPR
jgi:hypothetical protein